MRHWRKILLITEMTSMAKRFDAQRHHQLTLCTDGEANTCSAEHFGRSTRGIWTGEQAPSPKNQHGAL